ncbi:hypothetical protein ACE193_21300 [Bernardetia sp. OM2101]|uniref:hypothetical protein n=1 Tax=Bernardetia sp. OM2101 TaxID=3344876 RepID=UPI0035D0EFD5
MKVIIINTPTGQYSLPLDLVAKHRADYYVGEANRESKKYADEVAYAMKDSYEGIDWILNNSDWSDWENNVTQINNEVKLTEDFWTCSDDFSIVKVEDEVVNNDTIYIENRDKFIQISKECSHIPNHLFYEKQIRAGVYEYVKFLNKNNTNGNLSITSSSGENSLFAKERDGFFIPNNSLLLKSIQDAKNRGQYRLIPFCYTNIALDRLHQSLKS